MNNKIPTTIIITGFYKLKLYAPVIVARKAKKPADTGYKREIKDFIDKD